MAIASCCNGVGSSPLPRLSENLSTFTGLMEKRLARGPWPARGLPMWDCDALYLLRRREGAPAFRALLIEPCPLCPRGGVCRRALAAGDSADSPSLSIAVSNLDRSLMVKLCSAEGGAGSTPLGDLKGRLTPPFTFLMRPAAGPGFLPRPARRAAAAAAVSAPGWSSSSVSSERCSGGGEGHSPRSIAELKATTPDSANGAAIVAASIARMAEGSPSSSKIVTMAIESATATDAVAAPLTTLSRSSSRARFCCTASRQPCSSRNASACCLNASAKGTLPSVNSPMVLTNPITSSPVGAWACIPLPPFPYASRDLNNKVQK
eukprot:Hpha_TRINITY_DN11542_c0_g1::TRINITY_DN11542_c0_g1_i1::g.32354::m.32354